MPVDWLLALVIAAVVVDALVSIAWSPLWMTLLAERLQPRIVVVGRVLASKLPRFGLKSRS